MKDTISRIHLYHRTVEHGWHHWGYAARDGAIITFWKTDEEYGWVFKALSSYSTWGGMPTIDERVAEKIHKGYSPVKLTAKIRAMLCDEYTASVLFDRMHRGKRHR